MATPSDTPEILAKWLTTHDPSYREELVLRYVALVHFVLGRLGVSQNTTPEYEDLVSQGLLGLIEAIDRFNPEFGTQFSTYATFRIRGKILDYLRAIDWMPRAARKRSRMVQQAVSDLWLRNEHEPTDQEIADFLNLEVSSVQQALVDSSRMIVSLDAVIENDQGEDSSLHESLPDEQQENPADMVDLQEMKARLITNIKNLSDREQLVLSLYYYEELTFKEIGQVLGITESRVCQLHARAISRLKSTLNPAPDTDEEWQTSSDRRKE